MMRRARWPAALAGVLAMWLLFAAPAGWRAGVCGARPLTAQGAPAQAGVAPTPAAPVPVTMDAVNAIAYRLYCPVCPNERLDSCQTQACAEWRAVIAEQLGQGRTEADIRAYFVERYGERVLGTPESPALRLLSIGVPLLLTGAALAAGVLTFRRWSRADRDGAAEAPPTDASADAAASPDTAISGDVYRARLERDLGGER